MDEEILHRVDVLNEIDDCIQSCYCHRFSKIRGIDGVILVRPAGVINNPSDIVYNIIVLSEGMNSIEKQIVFIEYLINDYIAFKNHFEGTNITHDINVIYTQTSNMKNVIKEGDSKVKAFIASKKYGSPNANEITRGSENIFIGTDDVYYADFEPLQRKKV